MATAEECARVILDVVPHLMRTIRADLRSHRTDDLSVPQFRVLTYINRNPQASLSSLADHIGLTLPTMSKMVDGLVARKWVTREPSPDDRRRVVLYLTEPGKSMLESSLAQTQATLASKTADLTPTERDTVIAALYDLQGILTPGREIKIR